jgi:hypothetical protein
MRTLTRRSCYLVWLVLLAGVMSGCGNESARAPNPPRYVWPDSFVYRVQYVEETQSAKQALQRLEQTAELRFAVRNQRYLVWNDSVSKVTLEPGRAAAPGRINPEDTLHYLVDLGRLGEFYRVVPDCDPTVGACAAAFPSALPLELRRIIPRLPVWPVPRGSAWADTLSFDDLPRPGAAQGTVLTAYRVLGDTVIAGRRFWVIGWHSMRQAWREAEGRLVPDPVTQEFGRVLVSKARLVPAMAQWFGALAAPPALKALGVTGTGYRGRAWLAGSVFDSIQAVR